MAKGKSKNNFDLLSHTTVYSFLWYYPMGIMLKSFFLPFIFVVITLIIHTLTDYFTSRLNSRLWAKGDVHNFFVSVGFDQVLHYVQLFLTYYFLKNLVV